MKIADFARQLESVSGGAVVYSRVIPSTLPQYADLNSPLPERLNHYLLKRDLKLYRHQAETYDRARSGAHIMITTPTASGKTLAFNLAVFGSLEADPNATALYLYPLKALTQDQLGTLERLEAETGINVNAAIYDGDTPEHQRPTIRESSRIILTNPYALHQYLPWHHKWRRFFRNLRYVVLDESHVYRGVFGSNISLLLRRLRRIAKHYGAEPQFILSSATLANAEEHGKNLTGLDFELVDRSGAPQGERHFLFWNSQAQKSRSIHRQTSDLLAYCVNEQLQTLCFASSRKLAELVAKWAQQASSKSKIASYRAGYSADERREIERNFRAGELRGLASTTALELGIDIGSLDAVLISGYPGTVISTWQMAGRAGRGAQPSLITLMAFENPLDQYFMKHPEQFFSRPHEYAIVDLENPYILLGHTMCASAELPVHMDRDSQYFGVKMAQSLRSLEEQKLVQKTPAGYVYRGMARPTEVVGLDRISDRSIQVLYDGQVLESMDLRRAYEEAHPGAVLLHRGDSFIIKDLDLTAGIAHAVKEEVDYHTSLAHTSDVTIRKRYYGRKTPLGELLLGEVRVHEEFGGYRVRKGDQTLELHGLDLPPLDFETVALWFTLPGELGRQILKEGLDWAGGLHAAEHSLIAITPFHAMCDRWDIGGLSTTLHPDTREATIFIYDGYEGGIGIAEKAYELFSDLVETTHQLVKDCACEDGCPSCIYSPKCGNNNEPLDKLAAVKILDALKG
ncbi:DEAD/DEAH box helicase [Candidatus Acetothermia bacterium]|nr:DEAD/DEAH box helicase [Candidatus Acetothermia bacterium]MBI3642948.1 DEAD/DEAH box helicase [Candidatus Acetothermia bacterium]